MEPTDELDDADVVVLNTCCIRENADNKLYGHLGRLKALKAARPDLQIAVGGCLAQKDRELIVERAGHVDVVFGTHNLAHAADAARPGPRSRGRSSRSSRSTRRTRRRCRPAATSTTRPGSRSRSAATTRARSASCRACAGAEVSRRMGDIVHEVEELAADGVREITLLGQNVNSYGRDLGAGQYRPQFADLLRAVDAVDGIRPHPLHVAAPEGPAPRDDRGDGRVRRRCASTCTCRCSRAATARSRACTAATPPSATSTRLAAARAAIPDLAVTTDLIVGFPGETDDDFERTLEVVDAASYDAAYTFVFSPRPGTAAADDGRRLRARRGRAGAHAPGSRRSSSAHAERAPRGAGRAGRGGPGRGPVEEGPDRGVGPHPPEQARALRRAGRTPLRAGDVRRRPHHRGRAATGSRGELVDVTAARRAAPHPHPGHGRRLRDRHAPRARRADRVGEVGARRSRSRDALGDVEIVSIDSMQVYRGMDIGTAKPIARRAGARSRTTWSTSPTRRRTGRSRASRPRRARAVADIEARGKRALLVGGTGLYVQAVVDDLALPGRGPRACAPSSKPQRGEPDGLAARVRRARARRPGRRGAHRARQHAPHRARARGDPARPGSRSRRSGPGSATYGATVFPVRDGRRLAAAGRARATASRRGSRRCATPAWSTRSAALAADPRRLSRTARQAIGYKEILAYLDGDEPDLDAALDAAVRRTRAFARRQRIWFRRDPRITWFGAAENPCDVLPALLAWWCP